MGMGPEQVSGRCVTACSCDVGAVGAERCQGGGPREQLQHDDNELVGGVMAGVIEAFTRLLQRGGPGRIKGEHLGRETEFIHNGGGALGSDYPSVEHLWATEPHLRTVVDFVSRAVAQLNLHVFKSDGDANMRVRAGALPNLIKRPNRYTTRYELIYSLVADLMLYDAAYLVTLQAAEGWELHVLPSSWVTPVYGSVFEPPRYEAAQPGGGLRHTFREDEVIAFRGWTPGDPECTTSPVESLRLILMEQASARKHRTQVWQRNGRVGSYVTRPPDAGRWQDADRSRFMAMLEAFTGNRGPRAGGMPLLEDGMEIKRVGFSSADEQWSESVKLSLETVAQVYGVSPAMVGVLDNANRSNVREFRQSLYGDSLGRVITMREERFNAFLLPRVGAPRTQFVEFNVEEMLRGSFEDQNKVMQAAVGGPWMTVNEARRLQNLPPVDGGDDLIRPLSVSTAGGDAAATEEAEDDGAAAPKVSPVLVKAGASDSQRETVEATLGKFVGRQHDAVVARAGAKADGEDAADFWQSERWSRELSEDLYRLSLSVSAEAAREALSAAGLDPAIYDEALTEGFVKASARSRAEAINGATLRAILEAIEGGATPVEAVNKTFEYAKA